MSNPDFLALCPSFRIYLNSDIMKVLMCSIILFSFTACQPEDIIIDNVPDSKSKLVVSSFAGGEMQISVILTRSYDALELNLEDDTNDLISKYLVREASVVLKYDSTFINLQKVTDGFYGTNSHTPVTGKEYELSVFDWKSKDNVTSKTIAGGKAQFEDVSIKTGKTSFDTVLIVNYAFKDLPGESYYMINVQRSGGIETEDDILFGSRIFRHLINDVDVTDNSILKGEFTAILSKMKLNDTIAVSLANISPEYYQFLSLIKDGYLGPGLLMEPYNLPTNIKNGYGFFNMFFRDTRLLVLEN